MERRLSFHTGEFARICGVNKRTLHYYDEQGIFSPDHVGANGYRYYSVRQLYPFVLIRMLRQMGLDLAEIKDYMAHRSPERLETLLSGQEEWLRQEIRRLQAMKKIVQNQRRTLAKAKQVSFDTAAIEEMEGINLILSQPTRFAMLHGDWNGVERIIMDHMRYVMTKELNTGYAFGALVAKEDFLQPGQEKLITRFFTPTDKKLQHLPGELVSVRPSGKYLVTYFQGDYMDTTPAYKRIRAYLSAHPEIQAGPYSYEESILEDLSTADPSRYVTRIAVPILTGDGSKD